MHIPTGNIHWLFGTSMQIIATFVGLLAAGFFFFHDKLESEKDKDETLREIYHEIKKQYYRRFKILFAITGFSIITGCFLLYATAAGIEWQNGIVETVWLLHIFNLVLAGWFFIYLIDPDIIQHTARKLAKKNTNLFNPIKGQGISQREFIGKFSSLDDTLRAVEMKDNNSRAREVSIPFTELIRNLYEKGVINSGQLEELKQISMARNISIHSKDENIESSLGTAADKLKQELNVLNKTDAKRNDHFDSSIIGV